MSVPYVDKYYGEAVVAYHKISMQQMFTYIETDLKDALALVDDIEPVATPFTFSKDAILGLLTRFYLDKQDWDNCIKYADELLKKEKYSAQCKTASHNYH